MNALLEESIKGNRRALSRAISLVENREEPYLEILKEAYPLSGKARVIGITGAPGVGKSTITDKLVMEMRKKGKRIAVVAVDPSSAFSHGAILGDRIRMRDIATDDGVFIRSMASRGCMGGLAPTADDVVLLLDAAGYDTIIIETVGVGQDEVDIIYNSDIVLLLLVAGLGDDIQALKAGVMEIADIFVINKCDRPGSERLQREIETLISLNGEISGWQPKIAMTIAIKGDGISDVWNAILDYENQSALDRLKKRRIRNLERKLNDILEESITRRINDSILSKSFREHVIERIENRESDPFTIAEDILKKTFGNDKTSKPVLNHVAIAANGDSKIVEYLKKIGLSVTSKGDVWDQKVNVVCFKTGEGVIEVLKPISDESPISKFLAKKGTALHHVAIGVNNIAKTIKKLSKSGIRMIDDKPRIGVEGKSIAFIHPSSTDGILIELVEERGDI